MMTQASKKEQAHNLREKLRRAEEGEVVYLDPDETEASGLHDLDETGMTLQEALDAQWTPEELEEVLKKAEATDEYADKIIPAEVANEMLLTVMGTINAKLYEIEKDAPEEAEHLRKLRREIKKIKDQIRTFNPDFSNQIIAERSPVLKAKDNEKSLWEKINTLLPTNGIIEEETEKRRKAIANANASFELEGISITAKAQAWDERFIKGEISREEWLKGGRENNLNDDLRVKAKFGIVANALLEKVIRVITEKLRTIRNKEEAFFDLSDEDKKAFDKLNFMINELERLQRKIPEQTNEENHALSVEWEKLLHSDDSYKSLWERLEREGEKGRRRDAIESTNANFELEGEYRSKEAQERAERFINLELTEEEYFCFDSSKEDSK